MTGRQEKSTTKQLLLIQCWCAIAEDNIPIKGPVLRFAAPSRKPWFTPAHVMSMERQLLAGATLAQLRTLRGGGVAYGDGEGI